MSSIANIEEKKDKPMNYTVFHHQPLCHLMGNGEMRAEDLGWPENYEKTATVDAHNLEDVYAKTQHLHRPWWENKGVTAFGIAARSTSIGDIVQDTDGRLWVVASFGFEKLTGNLSALEKITNATISLDILGGCSMISVWCGHPDKITLVPVLSSVEGPVTQKVPSQRSSDFEAALEIACGRLLVSLVISRATSRQRTTINAS